MIGIVHPKLCIPCSMMVVLFRHGPAGHRDKSRWPDDTRRPLSTSGIERTRAAAHGLLGLLPRTPHVLTSPLVRAEQTAKILVEAAKAEAPELIAALAPGHTPRTVIRRLAECSTNDVVVLVGHEPGLGELAGMLVGGTNGPPLPLKKAGAAVVSFVGPVRIGDGRLNAMLPPRLLRRLGRHRKS